jgi:hypothetical protein
MKHRMLKGYSLFVAMLLIALYIGSAASDTTWKQFVAGYFVFIFELALWFVLWYLWITIREHRASEKEAEIINRA